MLSATRSLQVRPSVQVVPRSTLNQTVERFASAQASRRLLAAVLVRRATGFVRAGLPAVDGVPPLPAPRGAEHAIAAARAEGVRLLILVTTTYPHEPPTKRWPAGGQDSCDFGGQDSSARREPNSRAPWRPCACPCPSRPPKWTIALQVRLRPAAEARQLRGAPRQPERRPVGGGRGRGGHHAGGAPRRANTPAAECAATLLVCQVGRLLAASGIPHWHRALGPTRHTR